MNPIVGLARFGPLRNREADKVFLSDFDPIKWPKLAKKLFLDSQADFTTCDFDFSGCRALIPEFSFISLVCVNIDSESVI